ncbi:MAG: hypothetical protein GC151_17185 [Betaproteobacteria bacterium]|nr:hypothetical protein [Betaproteobacteria bacterium]
MSEILGLFPTPLMRIEKLLPREIVTPLAERFRLAARTSNSRSDRLSHSEIVPPGHDDLMARAGECLTPAVADFGVHLFGERLDWTIKEMWVNVLETGGFQAMHNHANSFVSGVVYLTPTHESAVTVFMKSPGGSEFAFSHANENTVTGPFNAQKFALPEPAPGDVVLFPSYLLHEVPTNRGAQRITLAFNAIPERLDSWGYSIRFGS